MASSLPPAAPETQAARLPLPAASSSAHAPLLLGLLFGALLSQNLAWPVVLRMFDAEWPALPAIIAMGFAFAEIGLAAVLLVMSVARLAIRGVIAFTLYLGAAFLAFRSVRGDGGMSGWLAIMLMCLGVIVAPLVIARLAGIAIVLGSDAGSGRRSRQYTTWGLLVLTTLVAVLLGIGRQLQFPWEERGEIGLFSVAIAVIPCVLGPLSLSKLPWPAALIAGATLCPVTGAVLAFTDFPPRQPLELAGMCSVQGLVIVASCAVVRIAGYRLAGPWER